MRSAWSGDSRENSIVRESRDRGKRLDNALQIPQCLLWPDCLYSFAARHVVVGK
jgi:hypothetical protein